MIVPERLLTLQDMNNVMLDLTEVNMKRRRPRQLHTSGVKLHDQRLAWCTGNILK